MNDIDDVYKNYAELVFKFLISLCNDEQMAQELTQETFYRAIKSSKRYDGKCKVSTWLCQIAKHIWYQEVDRRRRRGTCELDDNFLSDELGLEDTICMKDEKMAFYKAIHILDEPSKEVVLLHITGEFSFKEIGEIFDKSEVWARVTFFRAKQKIVKGKLK